MGVIMVLALRRKSMHFRKDMRQNDFTFPHSMTLTFDLVIHQLLLTLVTFPETLNVVSK